MDFGRGVLAPVLAMLSSSRVHRLNFGHPGVGKLSAIPSTQTHLGVRADHWTVQEYLPRPTRALHTSVRRSAPRCRRLLKVHGDEYESTAIVETSHGPPMTVPLSTPMTKLVSTANRRSPLTRIDLFEFCFDHRSDFIRLFWFPLARKVGK